MSDYPQIICLPGARRAGCQAVSNPSNPRQVAPAVNCEIPSADNVGRVSPSLCNIYNLYNLSLPCPLSSAFLANITGPIEGCKVFNSFIISDVPVAADPSLRSLSTTMRSLVWLSLLVSCLSLVSSQGNVPWPPVALTARWSLGKLTQLNPFSLPAGVSIDRILFCLGHCITFVTLLSLPPRPLMIITPPRPVSGPGIKYLPSKTQTRLHLALTASP